MDRVASFVEDHRELKPEVIAAERADAEAWVKAYQDYEDGLLRAGKDVRDEANFAAFYSQHGRPVRPVAFAASDLFPRDRGLRALLVLGVGALVVALIVSIAVLLLRRGARRRRDRALVPAA
jgi:hypothetical protein